MVLTSLIKAIISTIIVLAIVIGMSLLMNYMEPFSIREPFNDKDSVDFPKGSVLKFELIQFKQVIDETILKESDLFGGFFIALGGVYSGTKERLVIENYYYAYVKNTNGAILFAKIPAEKVRIYEDSETPTLVAWTPARIDRNHESKWDRYYMFNLHIPEGTIIPRLDMGIDLNDLN